MFDEEYLKKRFEAFLVAAFLGVMSVMTLVAVISMTNVEGVFTREGLGMCIFMTICMAFSKSLTHDFKFRLVPKVNVCLMAIILFLVYMHWGRMLMTENFEMSATASLVGMALSLIQAYLVADGLCRSDVKFSESLAAMKKRQAELQESIQNMKDKSENL